MTQNKYTYQKKVSRRNPEKLIFFNYIFNMDQIFRLRWALWFDLNLVISL